ncbi:hypothetical protein GGI15_002426 [Coemansia interrupta]|uniref:BIR-domain-containing protein n=1 Tax=Coemansia interrupta TaxID=1126814 RepID=A0A9W8HI56_9FUNG|nr:hypothetical protein GGI15_002426 [Coemansia interrupta]
MKPTLSAHSLKQRKDTFLRRGRAHSLKQRKDTFLRRGRYRWPYIKYSAYLAQPETLASAGFSFNQAKDAPDNVKCFHCGFELTGWEQSDDPFSEHYAHEPNCIYAKLHCQTRESQAGNKVEWVGWPVGKGGDDEEMRQKLLVMRDDISMRLETFTTNSWPHLGRKNWNVTPEKLAQAGFYYTPEWPGDDTSTCMFCGYALGDWEADDDPTSEHQRRVPDCLFFTLTANETTKLVSSPLPKGTPRRVSVRKSLLAPDVGDLGQAAAQEALDEEQESETSSSVSKRPRISDLSHDGQATSHEDEDEAEAMAIDESNRDMSEDAVAETEHEEDPIQEHESENEHMDEGQDGSQEEHDHGEHQDEEEYEDNGVEHTEHSQPTGAHTRPDVSVGADVSDNDGAVDEHDEYEMDANEVAEHAQHILSSVEDTQLSNTQVSANEIVGLPEEMVVDDEYRQTTQVEGAAGNDSWDLTEEEEEMTVEEFIRACCEQKVASLEASAAQMISSFTQRAEHTRERIYNMPW